MQSSERKDKKILLLYTHIYVLKVVGKSFINHLIDTIVYSMYYKLKIFKNIENDKETL